MNNTALVQPIKRAKGARAKASHHLKERKAKASTITTDTLMMGGTPHPTMTDHGINQTIKDNGAEMTQDHGPAITKGKIQKVRVKAEDAVGATVIFPATTVAHSLMSIRTRSLPLTTWIHLHNLNGLIIRPNIGWKDMIWDWLFYTTITKEKRN